MRNKFLSVTAALPLDDIGIFLNHFGSTLDLCTREGTSSYQIGTMCINEIIASKAKSFDTEQPTVRGQHVLMSSAFTNVNSMLHNNMAT